MMKFDQTLQQEAAISRKRKHTTAQNSASYLPRGMEIHHAPPLVRRDGYARLKRAGDVMLAGVMFVLALPVMLLAAALVRLTSKGPALYVQTRLGAGSVEFSIFKIRTMIDNCESLTGPRWSLPGDPRITPIGAILRATHIDELPQLWNVLRGDMSLIGPRPERPEIVRHLLTDVPTYADRLAVRPGISGLAQVQLPPDSDLSTVADKIVLDRVYIANMGAWLDLKILLGTGLKVLGLNPRRYRFLFRSVIPTDFVPGKKTPRTGDRHAA